MVHTDDREWKGRETRKGRSVTGADQGKESMYVEDIAGVSVRDFEGAL
jgi:hypothetical protein